MWLQSPRDLEALVAAIKPGPRVNASWTERGVAIEVQLRLVIEPGREAAVDLALLELNSASLVAGLRRVGSQVVVGHVAFLNHEGGVAAAVIERAIAACLEAADGAAARLAAAAGQPS